MFVLALTVLAFGGTTFAAEKGTEMKADKATEKNSGEVEGGKEGREGKDR